jgi:photosystem II stability/assembly factor-like uncharacterized protein
MAAAIGNLLYANCYVRAVWLNPENSQEMILGPADGSSGENGRIEHSQNGGQSWQPLTPSQTHNMVERFVQAENNLFAVMSNGSLWHSPLPKQSWTPILAKETKINALCQMA